MLTIPNIVWCGNGRFTNEGLMRHTIERFLKRMAAISEGFEVGEIASDKDTGAIGFCTGLHKSKRAEYIYPKTAKLKDLFEQWLWPWSMVERFEFKVDDNDATFVYEARVTEGE